MRRAAVFVTSFVTWCLLAWPYSAARGGWDGQSLLVGLVASLLVAVVFSDALARRPGLLLSPSRWFWLLCYIPVLAWYCLKANLEVVYLVLHPAMPIEPGIVKVRTTLRSETGISALANSITLTPGTLTVDVREDGYLYVHWLKVRATDEAGATEQIVSRFEKFLRRICE